MKRRFFIVSAVGMTAAASGAGAPALARMAHGKADAGSARAITIDVRRQFPGGAKPGGCSTHRRRSSFAGYTLENALSGKFAPAG